MDFKKFKHSIGSLDHNLNESLHVRENSFETSSKKTRVRAQSNFPEESFLSTILKGHESSKNLTVNNSRDNSPSIRHSIKKINKSPDQSPTSNKHSIKIKNQFSSK